VSKRDRLKGSVSSRAINARVYRKVVWQWVDGRLVELPELAQSFQYTGPVALAGGGSPNHRQIHFRTRTDSGTVDASPTWGAAEDTAYWPGYDTNTRLRVGVENTGTGGGNVGAWAYVRNGITTTTALGTATTFVKAVDAGSSADATAVTTQRLTAGTGVWQNGAYTEDGTATVSLTNGNFSEFEAGIQLLSADLGGGEQISLQAGIASGGYTVITTATYTSPNVDGSDFAHGVQLGVASNVTANAASISLTTIDTVPANNQLIVVTVSCDNNGTTDADNSEITGVTVGGNAATKAKEWSNSRGSAQAGATVSMWYYQTSAGLSSSSTITATFANGATSGDNCNISAKAYAVASGKTVSVEATNQSTANGAALPSLDCTTSNIECLRVRASAIEVSSVSVGQGGATALGVFASDTNWSLNWEPPGKIIGDPAVNPAMALITESRISTGTSAASTCLIAVSADNVSIYVAFKAAATGLTLAIDAGSYSVSGQDVTLAHAWAVAVDAGSYSISGQDVTLAKGQTVSVDAGSYSVTGQDVTLTHEWVAAVDAGSYSVTGQDVALAHGWVVGVDAGSYSVAGQDVTLAPGYAVAVDAGSYSISGQDVTLTHDWVIPIDSGSYAVTGQDVELTKLAALSIAVDAGSYSVTGQDVALVHNWAVLIDAGSYDVAGQDVTLSKLGALTIDVDAGGYAVTGQDVTLAHQWLMDVDSGGYLISGQDVELTLGGAAVATAGGYSDPGFWTEEHRKIKEREEGVPEPIAALSKLLGVIVPPKTWGDSDDLDELLELMEIMDHDSI
jgi:hypothetical protein